MSGTIKRKDTVTQFRLEAYIKDMAIYTGLTPAA